MVSSGSHFFTFSYLFHYSPSIIGLHTRALPFFLFSFFLFSSFVDLYMSSPYKYLGYALYQLTLFSGLSGTFRRVTVLMVKGLRCT
ncbi:hypothetical protein QBC37DRAFT_409180 [Rhypophila decipiens]|uniref:Uncharacterized protein n=1 Tax=Rhypophila decipiens TaxID=261697 RepID=A0AAN7BD41_9PEZI|nr:hypothetical protein QBC37DRAFT_409180 [Rhypophila decipiens]